MDDLGFGFRLLRAALTGRLRPSILHTKHEARPPCAFMIWGGLGDQLCGARYIRDLYNACGGFDFDVFSSRPDMADWIFTGMPGFKNCYEHNFSWALSYKQYAVRLIVTDYVKVESCDPNLSPNNRELRNLLQVVEALNGARRETNNLDAFMQHHPYMSLFIAQTADLIQAKRHDYGHRLSKIKYGGHKLKLDTDVSVKKFGLPQTYITIADGYDYSFHANGSRVKSTKSYPHFDGLVSEIKRRFPSVFIVQVGKDVGQPMMGVDRKLLNKTSLREIAAILENSILHIDNEGGLIHLASALGTQCCTIFGPTPVHYFGYPENINVPPPVCGSCYWTTKDWMTHCPRGHENPQCLSQQRPETIVDFIAQAIPVTMLTSSH